MHTRLHRIIALTAAGLAIAACGPDAEVEDEGVAGEAEPGLAVGADGAYPYSTWDTDQNRMLNATEFQTVANERGYARWNTTADAGLDENEFGTGLYSAWDRDRNGELNETEWRENATRWYGSEGGQGEWAEWNANGDGVLDANEFRQGVARTGLHDRWDADGNNMIAENEFGTGLFGTWDANRDTNVDANEWDLGAGGVDWF